MRDSVANRLLPLQRTRSALGSQLQRRQQLQQQLARAHDRRAAAPLVQSAPPCAGPGPTAPPAKAAAMPSEPALVAGPETWSDDEASEGWAPSSSSSLLPWRPVPLPASDEDPTLTGAAGANERIHRAYLQLLTRGQQQSFYLCLALLLVLLVALALVVWLAAAPRSVSVPYSEPAPAPPLLRRDGPPLRPWPDYD